MSVMTRVEQERGTKQEQASGGCSLVVRTAGRTLVHELRDEHCVPIARSVGVRTHTLPPGKYIIEVYLPGGGQLLHAVNLGTGSEAILELKLKANELQERNALEPLDPAERRLRRDVRVLNVLQFPDALSASPQDRIRQVTELDECRVFCIEPGRALAVAEVRAPNGANTIVAVPARGEQKTDSRRCWLTLRDRPGEIDASVHVRMGHLAADMAAEYLEAGRLAEALSVMRARCYQEDEVADPFRLALAAYAYLRHGEIAEADKRAIRLVNDYDWLPDGFALRAEIKAREGAHDVAAILCQRAIALGLPMFRDGLGVLVSRVRQYLRADLMKPSRKGIAEAFRKMLEMAPYVDWGSLVTTIQGWKFPSAASQETELDWMALDKLDYTDQALPENFLFPAGTYSALLHYSERRPKPRQEYQNLQREELIQAYRLMLTSRRLDDREIQLKRQNRVFFSISCAGHEAIQTAAVLALQPGKDWVFTYYRDRALVLGLGIRPYEMLLQTLGSAADTSGGRQITNSFTAPQLHIISNPGAVGTSFAQAVGCAHAARLLNSSSDEITVVSSGEGATNEGQFWEALNAACLDSLPVLFLVQDNGFAASMPVSQQLAGGNISDLVRSFPKLFIKEVDGTELTASWEAMGEAVAWCRERRGPALVHAHVVRLYSHSLSDDERMYKTQAQRTAEASRDPIANFGNWLTSQGFMTEADLRKLEHDVDSEIQLATERALTEPEADRSQNDRHLYSEVLSPPEDEAPAQPQPGATPATLVDSINRTLADEMARDKRIIVFGEDVADLADETQLGKLRGKGGAFKVTYGLQKQFGSARCFNTPVAESAIVGRAIGMALRGLKPVAEIQFMDYVWGAMLQIRNELAPMRWRSFNSYSCPVVIRIPTGGYLAGGGSFHSQSGEVAFAHIPGLRVVMPSTALDAAGLLRTALRCDDPVIFLEPKRLYREPYNRSPYPGPDFTIPFGRANIVKPGSSLTIITYGALVQRSIQAAQWIERERPGLTIEVIDLRSLAPYDWDAIVASVTKTSRALIAYEDWKSWGYGAELAARIGRELFKELDAPVGRVAAADRWIGYHPGLEDDTLPQPDDVIAEAEKIIDY